MSAVRMKVIQHKTFPLSTTVFHELIPNAKLGTCHYLALSYRGRDDKLRTLCYIESQNFLS